MYIESVPDATKLVDCRPLHKDYSVLLLAYNSSVRLLLVLIALKREEKTLENDIAMPFGV